MILMRRSRASAVPFPKQPCTFVTASAMLTSDNSPSCCATGLCWLARDLTTGEDSEPEIGMEHSEYPKFALILAHMSRIRIRTN